MKFIMFSVLVVGVVSRAHEEPQCSQYHFQERVLEKLVRLENKMELQQEKMASWDNTMQQKIDDLQVVEFKMSDNVLKHVQHQNEKITEVLSNFEKQVVRLSQDVFDTQNNVSKMVKSFIDQEKRKLEEFKADLKIPTIIFKAKGIADKSPPRNILVRYTASVTNIGNAYATSTGFFTVPYDGSYMFTINTCINKDKWAIMHIIAANNVIATTHNYAVNDVVCTTGTGVAVLKTGDKVWVKFHSGTSGATIYEATTIWNSFSGHLINV